MHHRFHLCTLMSLLTLSKILVPLTKLQTFREAWIQILHALFNHLLQPYHSPSQGSPPLAALQIVLIRNLRAIHLKWMLDTWKSEQILGLDTKRRSILDCKYNDSKALTCDFSEGNVSSILSFTYT